MAFQMIHMEIAYRLLKHIPQIEHKAEFILGCVAPDAVHMNPDYQVDMKVKTHMFEGCGTWSDTQDYQRWHGNICHVFGKLAATKESSPYRDFCMGLCVHCLTDYWNDLKIWRKLQHEHMPPLDLDEFKEAYYPEAKGIDVWLYQNSENVDVIMKMLTTAATMDVEGFVNKEDLERQQNHLLHTQYEADKVDISQYRFLSAETIEAFMKFTVMDIAETIRDWMREFADINGGKSDIVSD